MPRIVEMKEKTPLLLKKNEMEREVMALCRCGLAASRPFCDGSHQKAKDEQEGDLYQYRRNERGELERQEAEGVERGEADPRAGLPD